MFGISRAMKFAAVILAAAVMLISLAPPSYAESGTVRLRITRAGFIVGAGGGTGTLVFHGRTYPLSVGGLSVGTFGAATADVVGRAFNLRRAQDIVGTYTAVGAVLRLPVAQRRRASGTRMALSLKCVDGRLASRPLSISAA